MKLYPEIGKPLILTPMTTLLAKEVEKQTGTKDLDAAKTNLATKLGVTVADFSVDPIATSNIDLTAINIRIAKTVELVASLEKNNVAQETVIDNALDAIVEQTSIDFTDDNFGRYKLIMDDFNYINN